jgi:S-DNA-T family DNA segregation ATPase FtsK/SpoIIIE
MAKYARAGKPSSTDETNGTIGSRGDHSASSRSDDRSDSMPKSAVSSAMGNTDAHSSIDALASAAGSLAESIARIERAAQGLEAALARGIAVLTASAPDDAMAGERAGRGASAAEVKPAATRGRTRPSRELSDEALREQIAAIPVQMSRATPAPASAARSAHIPRSGDQSDYPFPGVDLLDDPECNDSAEVERHAREQALALSRAFEAYGVRGEITGIECGPVVTIYSVELEAGTRVARLETISKDVARALKARNIRVIPNMKGTDCVGIEVPNQQKEKVRLKELMSGGEAAGMALPMFLGKDSAGDPLVLDLAKMPHMLIAGTTGSGKSVCMNTIIMSFLYTKRPDELKLVLVDPKMVEMAQFADVPHLACPVVTEMRKATAILEWAVNKVDERHELLKEAGVRDIKSFNALTDEELRERMEITDDTEGALVMKKMPYMVFVIDELADLMATCREAEDSIVRIAQKARAVGIHLILATQRPQANVVTGLIKSNMPCRVAFKVASSMDSRIVLDQKGAELLLGQGDMLVVTPSQTEARRCQGTLVEDREARGVAQYLRSVAPARFERALACARQPARLDEPREPIEPATAHLADPLFDRAVELMIECGRGSVSLLQRRLAIGYGRASRLVDLMGQAGLLGEHKGAQAREVTVTMEEWQRIKATRVGQAQVDPPNGGSASTG